MVGESVFQELRQMFGEGNVILVQLFLVPGENKCINNNIILKLQLATVAVEFAM